jgi:polyvinyl alcohol dehydrogenase (cytochrome)
VPVILVMLASLLAFALPASAGAPLPACADGSCVPGGGKAATDCFAEFAGVHLNAPFSPPGKTKPKKELRCFDGDAGCDLDGEVNGSCRFPTDVCLFNDDPNLPECTAAQVTEATATAKQSADGAAALQTAIGALLPAAASACTDGASIDVPLKVNGKGVQKQAKATLKVKATTASGKDSDTLKLTCLPRVWPTQSYDGYNRRATQRTQITPANAASLVEKWSFTSQGGVSSTPTVSDKMVYATSWDGLLYALDRKNGKLKWSFDTGGNSIQSSATLTPDGRVLFGDSEANVYCLDAKKGTLLWERNVEILPQDHIWGSPNVVNNRVFVPIASDSDNPCTKGRLEALDLDTGDPLWTARTAPDRVCEDESTVGCTTDAECPGSRCVGMCSGDRGIACADDAECTGFGTCQDAIGGGVTATPATDPTGETVFMASVGCYTGPRIGNADRIFRIRASDGTIEWALPDFGPEAFGSPSSYNDYGFLNGPIVVNGATPVLVAASKDGKVYARDATTGAEVWTETVGDVTLADDGFAGFGLFNGHPALADGRVYTSLNQFNDGTPTPIVHTQAFDLATGDNAWVGSVDVGATWGVISVGGGVVFQGTSNLFGALPEFHAFDASNGMHLTTFTLPSQTSSGPSLVDGELFIGFGLGLLAPEPSGVRAYELP